MRDDEKPDYRVGYKKPPLHARFKKGKSANPRGRPRGSKNLSTLLDDALNEPVVVTENGKSRRITKWQLGVRQLANKFKGSFDRWSVYDNNARHPAPVAAGGSQAQ